MALLALTSTAAVEEAMDEFDKLGQDAFLTKYGYGPAKRYFVERNGRLYDSKALWGVAIGYQFPERGFVQNNEFSGGEGFVLPQLRKLGFEIRDTGAPEPDALHLLVKWSARLGSGGGETVENHIRVAEQHGAVWWGLWTLGEADHRVAQQWVDRLRNQIAEETSTHVFVSGLTCWTTDLLDVVYTREETEEDLIPSYYDEGTPQKYHLWVKLTNFQPTDRDALLRDLDADRATSRGKPIALGNQTNPLFVRLRDTPRTWWVNQGATFKQERAGGYLWAPQRNKAGAEVPHHSAMKHIRPGDVIFHYAKGIRAVSVASRAAQITDRPAELSDAAWDKDGYMVSATYRELSAPIELSRIPVEWRTREGGPFTSAGAVVQGYLFPLSDRFARRLQTQFPELAQDGPIAVSDVAHEDYLEPTFDGIVASIRDDGLTISRETIRRYHLSLKTRGFVVLSGISGTGKTWLAQAYAKAIAAEPLIVPVAPNWTTNEDLLGYLNPVDGHYHDTEFSRFLRRAADEYTDAVASGREPRPYHLILDEMNLARVEYYFAKFLSAMEIRFRSDDAAIELASDDMVLLPPNLRFTGTVNVDETTHGFADKVYDRSQLIELTIEREQVVSHLGQRPLTDDLADVWSIFQTIAPFAYRVLDEIVRYVDEGSHLGVSWEEALDEQLLQKVLPKVRGTDLAIGPALRDFVELAADRFPLSRQKAETMRTTFEEHGFTSYF